MFERSLRLYLLLAAAVSTLTISAAPCAMAQAVTTYHVDNNRTGWNSHETVLTPANVGSSSFGLLKAVPLNDQVDSQPLFVPGVNITAGSSKGIHDVVYVATESNTVYAIDAESGTVLLNPNFGKPVTFPLGCNNNGPNVGINSTPVIDIASNTMYVMIYTQDTSGPAYRIHALDLGSLTDKVAAQLVVASHTLLDGSTFNFNATYQRQRPGLLLANGTVYAGFGSFCDLGANLSRGWLLGWTSGSLAPLPANQVFDTPAFVARQLLPFVDLDVRLRSRYGRCRQYSFCDRKLRLLRHDLRRRQQYSGKRCEGVLRSDHGARPVHAKEPGQPRPDRRRFRRGRSARPARPARARFRIWR